MRRIGLGETLRIALTGNDERVSAETALRIGLVTEVVEPRRSSGRAPTRSRPASRPSRRRRRRARCGRSGSRSTSPTAPRMEQGLIYTRLGNPIGMAELAGNRAAPAQSEPRIR